MHAHLARRDGQRRDRLADDADDLGGVGLELAPHDLARERHGEGEELPLHLVVELLEGLREVVKHALEPLHLGGHLGASRLRPSSSP